MKTIEMNRREACASIAAYSLLGGLLAQLTQTASAQALPGAAEAAADLSTSRVFHFEDMPVTHSAVGGWGRAVIHGTLPTGEFLEIHETMLPPGKMPHPPHKHSNSEFIILREGKVQYLSDGHKEIVNVGDVIYTASNKPHGMLNVGDVPAIYFVVSVGVQDKATMVQLAPAV